MVLKNLNIYKKTSLIIISLIALYSIAVFFKYYLNNNAYEFDPWLSNYQGGFVRRGLPGEIFYIFYQFLKINPAIITLIFVSLLYVYFYWSLLKNLLNLKISRLLLLVLFSPLALFFPIINSKAIGHKEILFFVSFFIFYLLIKKFEKFYLAFFLTILIIFLGLSYEALLFYSPYLIILFFFKGFNSYKEFFYYLFYFSTISLSILLINYVFKGNSFIVSQICDSVINFVNPNCETVGKIADLKLSVQDHTIQKTGSEGALNLYKNYFFIYPLGAIYGLSPLLIFLFCSSFTDKKIKDLNLLLVFASLFILTIPVYYFGADWGRYLNITNISSIILILILINEKKIKIKNNFIIYQLNKIPKFIFLIFVFLYALSFSVPICCQTSFKLGLLKFFL